MDRRAGASLAPPSKSVIAKYNRIQLVRLALHVFAEKLTHTGSTLRARARNQYVCRRIEKTLRERLVTRFAWILVQTRGIRTLAHKSYQHNRGQLYAVAGTAAGCCSAECQYSVHHRCAERQYAVKQTKESKKKEGTHSQLQLGTTHIADQSQKKKNCRATYQ